MTTKLLTTLAAIGLALVAGACVPDTPVPTTTTLPPIQVGCHDGLGSDLYFNGPINTLDNADIHQTNDGTCGHYVAHRTIVQAVDKSTADALCVAAGKGRAGNDPLDDPSFGYLTLVDGWECTT